MMDIAFKILWLDFIKDKIVTKEQGLSSVFPIVVYGGNEKRNDPLSIHELLSPMANVLLKYQPNNLTLLVEDRTFKDEVLNKNSDFYALYLELTRSKTPSAMRNFIEKYKDVPANPEHH